MNGHSNVIVLMLMGLSQLTLQMLSTHVQEATPTKWQLLGCYIYSYSPLNEWSLQCDHPNANGVIPTDITDVVNTCTGSHTHKMAAVNVHHLELLAFK